MPNHFLVIGLCGRDWERLEAIGRDDHDEIDLTPIEGVNLCEIIDKLPEELEGVVSMNPLCRYRHKHTGEYLKDCNGPMMLDDREQWEQVILTESEINQLCAKYGAASWYEWQQNNWGTKWGTYNTTVHSLGGDGSPILIEFQSAWGPPKPEIMRKIDDFLCETYFLKNIRWIGHDPFDGSTVEIEIAKEGTKQ
jgi:hypothetical protein